MTELITGYQLFDPWEKCFACGEDGLWLKIEMNNFSFLLCAGCEVILLRDEVLGDSPLVCHWDLTDPNAGELRDLVNELIEPYT